MKTPTKYGKRLSIYQVWKKEKWKDKKEIIRDNKREPMAIGSVDLQTKGRPKLVSDYQFNIISFYNISLNNIDNGWKGHH